MFRIKSRRIGKFTIKQETFEDNFDWIVELFSLFHIIPLRVDYKFEYSLYEYTAYSEDFDIVPRGEEIPTYKFELYYIDGIRQVVLKKDMYDVYLTILIRARKKKTVNKSYRINEAMNVWKDEVKALTLDLEEKIINVVD